MRDVFMTTADYREGKLPAPPRFLADDPNHWRERGEQMRLIAQGISDAKTKKIMLEIGTLTTNSPTAPLYALTAAGVQDRPPHLAAFYLYLPASSHQSFLSLSGLIFSPCRNAKMTNANAARRTIAPIHWIITVCVSVGGFGCPEPIFCSQTTDSF
jgi:hypothetical protein